MVLVWKHGEKRPFGRTRCRWGDNITMVLQDMGWGRGLDWIDLAQGRNRWQALVNAVMNLQITLNVGNFLTG